MTQMSASKIAPAELLSLLVCPVCRQALESAPASLRCTGCGNYYPIVDGIPVLLTERASKDPPAAG